MKHVKEHKFKPGAYPFMERMINKFWDVVVNWLPPTLAPNTVTLLGILFLVGTYSIMLYYDITMTQNYPRWVYLATAFGVFMFQTLDGVDGKQARKTNSSSPLGQLFDHGLDGISWTIVSMNAVSLLGLGLTFKGVLWMLSCWGPLYLTTLLEYYNHLMIFKISGILNWDLIKIIWQIGS